jgi:hypothetical protein
LDLLSSFSLFDYKQQQCLDVQSMTSAFPH